MRMSKGFGQSTGIPLVFKLWAALIMGLALTIFAIVFFAAFYIASDPKGFVNDIGSVAGEAVNGFCETTEKCK